MGTSGPHITGQQASKNSSHLQQQKHQNKSIRNQIFKSQDFTKAAGAGGFIPAARNNNNQL